MRLSWSLVLSAKRHKPVKRKIHLWKKADLDAMKNEIDVFYVQFHARFSTESSTEAMWGSVKSKLLEVMDSLVPSKIATMRHNQPWITREVKRLSRRKQRAYMKAKRSGCEQDWKRYKKLNKHCQGECHSAYNTYITEMIAPDMDSHPKKFWSFIKSKHTDKLVLLL